MKIVELSDDALVDDIDDRRLYSGMRLGRYELVLPIARGGMARVWAGRLHGERGFAKPVAIKTILSELTSQPLFERMFLDEAQIASAVHHPNVCEIYELGEDNGLLYLAMEWINGDSLAKILLKRGSKANRVDVDVAARIVADACAGLHSAHELTDDAGEMLHVVHRDISPHNILVTVDGITKVADFGIAKALNGFQHEVTRAGQLKGKLAYMSPEYVQGEPLDRRTDIFSMGATLYEATTGEQPFKRENEAKMLLALVEGDLVPPSRLIANYPPELEHIVLTAMATDRDHRFPTAHAMRSALDEFLARTGMIAHAHNRVVETVRTRLGDELTERRDRLRQVTSLLSGRHPAARPQGIVSGYYPANATAPMTMPERAPASVPPMPVSLPPPSLEPSAQVMTISEAIARPKRARIAVASLAFLAALAGGAAGIAALRWTPAVAPPAAGNALPPPPAVNAVPAVQAAKSAATINAPSVLTPGDLPNAGGAKAAAATPPAVQHTPQPQPAVRWTQPSPAAAPARPAMKGSDNIPDNPYAGTKLPDNPYAGSTSKLPDNPYAPGSK